MARLLRTLRTWLRRGRHRRRGQGYDPLTDPGAYNAGAPLDL